MFTRRRWFLAAALGVLAMPAPASALTLRGKSDQGREVVMRLADGDVLSVRIDWRARCGRTTYSYRSRTGHRPPFDLATRSVLRDAGSYRLREGDGIRSRTTTVLRARRISSHVWSGTFRATVVLRRSGRWIDTCRLRTVRWSARTPYVRLKMTSDAGDPMGGGQTYSFASPVISGGLNGRPDSLTGSVPGWFLEFEARGALRRETYQIVPQPAHARPRLSVTTLGADCFGVSGEFTIRAIAFDRRGHPRHLDVSFVQHCNGSAAALRGRFVYRA